MSSVRREEHNLTTREALQLFEATGLPRNQRSIERYCADGKLDAFFDSDEQRYYISRASVDRLIGQLTEIKTRHEAISAVGPAVSDGIRPATTPARHDRDERQESTDHADIKALQTKLATLEDEKKTLEEKNFTLLYEKKASDQVVTMMREQLKEDRQEFFQQMDKLVKEIGETKQLVGELQTQLKQIAAPRTGNQSDATTATRQITEAEVVDDIPPTTPSDTSPGRPHPFRPPMMDIREASSEELV
jgi:chromosome segregation ATPase